MVAKLDAIANYSHKLFVRFWPKADYQFRGVGSVSMTAIE